MKYNLRSLLIVVILLPPLIAGAVTLTMRWLAEPEAQTLPPMSSGDDIQYFEPSPEFKLSREAAMLRAFKEDQERARQAFCPLPP